MSDRRVRDHIESELTALPPGALLVAHSGGLDSTVLLHALAQSNAARERGLRAVHIDHRLRTESAMWARHCISFAEMLGVPIETRTVEVARTPGLGLEATARRARYGAIEAILGENEILALGHHRDDQAETVLLKLLRGAGPEGLGAMRTLRPLGRGKAWRPLLSLPRATLHAYGEHHELSWIEDPSNADLSIDRNFLRAEILPRIARRWPEAESSIAQSASWARAAADFVDAEAERVLAGLQGLDPATLRFREWLALPDALRDPVLRRWLRSIALPEPTQFQVAELVRQLGEAGEDKQPCVRWPGVEVRRYRDLLHALPPLQLPPLDWSADFDGDALVLPADIGTLRLVATESGAPPPRLPQPARVRFRRGGESLRLKGGAHTRELRDLLQEAGIPPWQRSRLPLIFDAERALVAVADLWISDAGAEMLVRAGARLDWSPSAAPAIDLAGALS